LHLLLIPPYSCPAPPPGGAGCIDCGVFAWHSPSRLPQAQSPCLMCGRIQSQRALAPAQPAKVSAAPNRALAGPLALYGLRRASTAHAQRPLSALFEGCTQSIASQIQGPGPGASMNAARAPLCDSDNDNGSSYSCTEPSLLGCHSSSTAVSMTVPGCASSMDIGGRRTGTPFFRTSSPSTYSAWYDAGVYIPTP